MAPLRAHASELEVKVMFANFSPISLDNSDANYYGVDIAMVIELRDVDGAQTINKSILNKLFL
jgi:hypothetical protein